MAKPPKALLERAVKAAQLYCGSTGARIRDQQKLYKRLQRDVESVVKKSGADTQSAHDQIVAEAKKRGCIRGIPGKDY
jgi:hypothetical protein